MESDVHAWGLEMVTALRITIEKELRFHTAAGAFACDFPNSGDIRYTKILDISLQLINLFSEESLVKVCSICKVWTGPDLGIL